MLLLIIYKIQDDNQIIFKKLIKMQFKFPWIFKINRHK